jgi:hypothetical protein
MADMRATAWPEYGRAFDVRYGQTGSVALDKLRIREGSERFANEIEVLSLRHLSPRRAPSRDAPAPREVERFDDRLGRLWHEASGQFNYIPVRSSAYLNWRYADPRAGRFSLLVVEEADGLAGYTVARMSHGRGYLCDILARPDRLDVADALIGAAIDRLRAARVDAVECWLPRHHPYKELLRQHGFLHRKRVVEVTYGAFRAPEDAQQFLREPRAAIHFTSGDSDLV